MVAQLSAARTALWASPRSVPVTSRSGASWRTRSSREQLSRCLSRHLFAMLGSAPQATLRGAKESSSTRRHGDVRDENRLLNRASKSRFIRTAAPARMTLLPPASMPEGGRRRPRRQSPGCRQSEIRDRCHRFDWEDLQRAAFSMK